MDDEKSKLREAYALTEEGGQTPGPPVGRNSVRARIRVPEELPPPKKINAVILTPEIVHIERGSAVREVYGTLTSFVYYDSVHYDSTHYDPPDYAAVEATEAEAAETEAAAEGLADDYFLDLAEAFPEKPMEGFGEPAAANLLDLEILEGEAWEISPGIQCLKHQVPFYLTLDQINQGGDRGDDQGESLGLEQATEPAGESAAMNLIPEVEQVECQVLGPRILDLRVEMRLKAPTLPQTTVAESAEVPPIGLADTPAEAEIEEGESQGGFKENMTEIQKASGHIESEQSPAEQEQYQHEPYQQEQYQQEQYQEEQYQHEPYQQEPYQQEPYQEEQYQQEPQQGQFAEQYEPQQGQFAESYEGGQAAEPYEGGQFQAEQCAEAMADEDLDSKVWEEADFPEAIDLAAIEDPAALREEMAGELAVEAGELPVEIVATETEADWALEADAEPEAGFDLAAEAEIEAEMEAELNAELEAEAEAEVEFEAEAELSEAADAEIEFEMDAELNPELEAELEAEAELSEAADAEIEFEMEAEVEAETELFGSDAEAGVETELEPAAESEFFEGDETAGDTAEAELSDDFAEAAEAGLSEPDSLSPAWVGIGYKTGSINRRRPGRVERDARLAPKNGESGDSDKDLSAEAGFHLGSGLPRPRSLNRSRSDGTGQSKEDYYAAVNPPVGLPKIASRHSGKRQSNVYRYYLIQPGDDWEKVAANYQLSIAAIKEANPAAPEDLVAGQRLKIPAAIQQDK